MTISVSIVMPVYNAAQYVGEAIESMLAQTYTDFEFIIIDDDSTDNSLDVIEEFKDSRISIIRNPTNLGLVGTLNIGIERALGKYIARMDADDISLPERLEKQVKFMDKNEEVAVCGTGYQYFGESSTIAVPETDFNRVFTLLSYTSPVGHPTCMIRKSFLQHNNLFYEAKYGYAADYGLWLKIIQLSKITSLPEILLLYRWHGDNMTKTDHSRAEACALVRTEWYELVTEKKLSEAQKAFLAGDVSKIKHFDEMQTLINSVLDSQSCDTLDKNYFGELTIADFEIKSIKKQQLSGLLKRLADRRFRTLSSVTDIGLIAFFIQNFRSVKKQIPI